MKTIDYKIPPHLPLLKGGNAPLFGKPGDRGDFSIMMPYLYTS